MAQPTPDMSSVEVENVHQDEEPASKNMVKGLTSLSTSSLRQKLCADTGLSDYEARAYVSLVTKGASRARRLSMLCGVPRTKIYVVLKKLIERGLVIEMPEEPRRFAPVSPSNAFEQYLDCYEKKARDLYLVVSRLEKIFESVKTKVKPEKKTIWMLRGRTEILQRVQVMLSHAKDSVDVTTNENGLILFYKTTCKLLDKLLSNGIKVRIATPMGTHTRGIIQELRYVSNIKQVDFRSPVLCVCIDNRKVLVAGLTPDDFTLVSSQDRGVYSNSPSLWHLISLLLSTHMHGGLILCSQCAAKNGFLGGNCLKLRGSP